MKLGHRRAALAVLAAGTVAAFLAAGSASGSTQKMYAANFAPQTVSAGVVQIAAAIKNESNPQGMTAANLLVPSGLSAQGIVSVTSGPSVTSGWTASLGTCPNLGSNRGSNPCVRLRGPSLPPGNAVSATMTIQTPASNCSGASSTYNWLTDVRQDNNFNGSGNELALDTATSQRQTVVINSGGATHLKFVAEPADANVNTAITSSPYNTSGAPVEVDVLNACNQLANSSNVVTLGLNRPAGNSATLSGGSAAASAGRATFPNLQVDRPDNGYRLAASDSAGSAGDTSTAFNVTNASKFCAQDDLATGPCTTNLTSPSNNSSSVTASPQAGPNSGYLEESVNIQTSHPLDCSPPERGGYVSPSPDTWEFKMNPSTHRSEIWKTTLRNPILPLPEAVSELLNNPKECYGATVEFTMANGQPAPAGILPDGTSGFVGTLPNCPAPGGPCVDQAGVTRVADLNNPIGFDITVPVDVPPGQGDPHIR